MISRGTERQTSHFVRAPLSQDLQSSLFLSKINCPKSLNRDLNPRFDSAGYAQFLENSFILNVGFRSVNYNQQMSLYSNNTYSLPKTTMCVLNINLSRKLRRSCLNLDMNFMQNIKPNCQFEVQPEVSAQCNSI